jgi:hypothetical protein
LAKILEFFNYYRETFLYRIDRRGRKHPSLFRIEDWSHAKIANVLAQ